MRNVLPRLAGTIGEMVVGCPSPRHRSHDIKVGDSVQIFRLEPTEVANLEGLIPAAITLGLRGVVKEVFEKQTDRDTTWTPQMDSDSNRELAELKDVAMVRRARPRRPNGIDAWQVASVLS